MAVDIQPVRTLLGSLSLEKFLTLIPRDETGHGPDLMTPNHKHHYHWHVQTVTSDASVAEAMHVSYTPMRASGPHCAVGRSPRRCART